MMLVIQSREKYLLEKEKAYQAGFRNGAEYTITEIVAWLRGQH